jgi:GNAT superfamily N-acetyltransferase
MAVLAVHARRDPGTDAPTTATEAEQEAWAATMACAPLAVYVAEVQGDVVGTASYMVMPDLTYGCAPTAFVEAVVVTHDHRRRGIATQIMRQVLADADAAGCYKVQLLSHKRHATDGAHALYQSLGFSAEAEGFRLYLLSDRPDADGDLDEQPEQPLHGGMANAGQVVRVGDEVLRPGSVHARSIHRLLSWLPASGFVGAPEPIGIDPDGREQLGFIKGDVALVPYPAWAQADQALASIAVLPRRFHDASRAFDPDGMAWSDEVSDPAIDKRLPEPTIWCCATTTWRGTT